MACVIINSQPNFGKTKRKFIKPEDILKLPGDSSDSSSISTEEMIKLMQEEEN